MPPPILTEREYRYWITQNCPRNHCWIVAARLGEMIAHSGKKVYGQDGSECELRLTHDTLKYVYFAHFDKNRVITLVQDSDTYYLIDNEQAEDGGAVKSTIYCGATLSRVLEHVTGARKKAIGLKPRDKATLSDKQRRALRGVTYIDFINASKDEQLSLWEKYTTEQQGGRDTRLDLSGFTMLTDEILDSQPLRYQEVVLYQNNSIRTFTWLSRVAGLKTLSIWFNNGLRDADIENIAASAPGLEAFEVHSCMSLTGRMLLPLSKMASLNKLIINNVECAWQEKSYETVISDEEWGAVSNSALRILLIDSYNLTLDVIAFILRGFKDLTNFIMCPQMLQKLRQNSAAGYMDEKVTFHSAENYQDCFTLRRDVRVYDLVRSKCGNKFSESMLRKISERDPSKAEAAENLRINVLKTSI